MDRVLVTADANESDLLLNQRMGYVAVSRAREDAIVFTNSTDQLRRALDRNVNKEMAIEAVRQSRDRENLSREQWEHLLSSNETKIEQSPLESIDNSGENRNLDEASPATEIEIDLSS